MSRARNWCFTLNNPSLPYDVLPTCADLRYASWQLEKGAAGTLHLQGYVEFHKALHLATVKLFLPGAHWEPRRGTAEQARDYTRKEDSREDGPWEFGEFAKQQGKRNDINDARDAILAGISDEDFLEQYAGVLARHPRFVDTVKRAAAEKKRTRLTELVARPWQQPILDMVADVPSDRQVLWVFDHKGGHGKTHLARYLCDTQAAFYTNGGKGADICYAYSGQRICIFDYVRDSESFVNYGVIEQIKNGILFSSKYDSGMKRFDTPHVVIFANFAPDRTKMSADRWVVIRLFDNDWELLD